MLLFLLPIIALFVLLIFFPTFDNILPEIKTIPITVEKIISESEAEKQWKETGTIDGIEFFVSKKLGATCPICDQYKSAGSQFSKNFISDVYHQDMMSDHRPIVHRRKLLNSLKLRGCKEHSAYHLSQ
jgi:hypothetical protein